MSDVTGWTAVCRCGVTVAAIDRKRSPGGETSRILREALLRGCTIVPVFEHNWSVTIGACECPPEKHLNPEEE